MRSFYRCLAILLPGVVLMSLAHSDPVRVLVFDSEGGMTARALKALQVPHTLAAPSTYASRQVSLFDCQLAVWGMDVDQGPLNAAPERLQAFLRSGGVLLCMRMQQPPRWLEPAPAMDKAYHLGEILQPAHPLFSQPHKFAVADLAKVHGGSIYRAFYNLPAGAVPLLGAGAEQEWDKTEPADKGAHYGILEWPVGKGRVIFCQMIPDYGYISDDNSAEGPGSRFMANLLAYACAVAPKWPAPQARVVPGNFHADLADLLRPATAAGSMPMADPGWQVSSKGPFAYKTDRRGVMTMSYPDRPAAAGEFVQVTRTVQLPAGGAYLRFYNSDDYCGGNEPQLVGDRSVGTRENKLKDVRFKQVLVNGKVVWEEDVLGRNAVPAERRFVLVNLSDHVGKGGAATIALRVENRAATAADFNFATDVYWAGLDVLPGLVQAPVKEGQTSLRTAFSGPAGRYAVLARVLDEHTGRSKLQAAVNGKPLSTVQLTADDYGWYWINFGSADLKPGSAVTLQATPDAEEACRIESLLLVPQGLLAGRTAPPSATPSPSPLYKPLPAATRESFPVLVSGPEAYKPQGEIVSGGVPFGYGKVKSEQNIRLLNDQGREVPLQTRVLAKWPDESLKWVLFTFPTAPGAVRCEYGAQVKRGPVESPALKITETDESIAVDTGPLQATLSKRNGELLQTLSLGDRHLKTTETAWPLLVATEGKRMYSSAGETVTRCEVIDGGPLRLVVRRVGRMRAADGSTFLEYDLITQFDVNSGVIRFFPVFTHKEETTEAWISAAVQMETEDFGPEAVVWLEGKDATRESGVGPSDPADPRDMVMKLTALEGSLADGTIRRPTGFMRVAGSDVSLDLIPRWFWQMYPKTNHGHRRGLDLTLIGSATIHQGQAFWNDFALRFSEDTGQPNLEDFDALASPAVVTAEPSYVASTLALGEFAAANAALFPEYEESVESVYRGYLAKREQRREYGLENLGDDTFEWGYGPSYTFWSNQEYDHHYGMLLQFLRSGDYRWWEIGDQGARHYRDVDCYHWAPGREYLVGAPHHHNSKHIVEKGWVADHTVAGASNGHSWIEGVIAYYFLTGDPRSYELFNNMGNWYCHTVANNMYGAGGQERGPGWTLVALSALYNATYDKKYLKAGSAVMDWLRSVQDPVRGVISIPISEQPSYEGGTAFMHGIVARGAGRWYEATGDVRGKEAVLGIADWLTTEAMGPPARFFYKQAPTQKHGYGTSEWQCFTALSYAAKYGDPQWYGALTEEHYSGGRAGTRSIAWAPQSLGHLLPFFTPLRAKLATPQAVLSPDQPAEIKLQLINTTDKPLKVEAQALAVPAGLKLAVPPAMTLEPMKATDFVCTLSAASASQAPAEVRLRLTAGESQREYAIPVQVVERLVQLEASAKEARLQAPFAPAQKDPAAVGVTRDATFTGNPRQVGERAGWAEWQISVPVAGTYYLAADCFWLDDKGNSFFVQVDEGEEKTFGNDSAMGRWHWVRGPEALQLKAGTHTIRLLNREDGGLVRRLMLTNVEGRLPN